MPISLPGIAGKDEFLGVLAHELRNPLAAIESAARLLEIANLEEDERLEAAALIRRQVRNAVRLVDDLMDVSRIVKGKMALREEQVPVAVLMREGVESIAPSLEVSGHQLTVEAPDDHTLCVRGDHVRLLQVFSNLLGNAAKYTNPGGQIRFSCQRDDQHVVFRIQDNGIGIRSDALENIFQMFNQENRKESSGLGIGLSLVQRLVHLHDGTVEAHSEGEGRGSTFLVRFPVLKMTVIDKPIKIERGAKLKVLVIDDTPDAASALAAILGHLGYETKYAVNGTDGLALADEFLPDVAVVDIQMPDMSGVEVARRMHEKDKSRLLVAITGYTDTDYSAYFHHQMHKPVNIRELHNEIGKLVA